MGFIASTSTSLSSLCSDPLFSFFVALYSLILLYFPQNFLNLVFSPVLISTVILLSALLRLGAIQCAEKHNGSGELVGIESPDEDHKCFDPQTGAETETQTDLYRKPSYSGSFVEWNLRGPLEIIYEEYDGEEEDDSNEKETRQLGLERLCSLSLYYPESDTDSSSADDFPANEGWDSPENTSFRWEEEDQEGGLIEIPLNLKRNPAFRVEEENLIEIEISPARNFLVSGESPIN